ncbi:formate hydrogenase [Cryobacterium melibiosiphilum]|uniref:Formate hydrogenase n=1 Tax=Cryobacterium melibiosiphilum TaxID=995039 RepID=A0A3A5MB42_9MICO|nr:NADH-quinone oxidoreductase subunit C [Cryobacterium melibiosiphilum]RJT87337.1 formate hydrogenase [Cryobacterium melibiosiphilum]
MPESLTTPPAPPAPLVDRRSVSRDDLSAAASGLLNGTTPEDSYRLALVACHDDDAEFRIVYVFAATARLVELTVRIPKADAWIPSLAHLSLAAGNFEREMRDLFGVRPHNHPQPHRLVRHGHWPRGWYPMLADPNPMPEFEPDVESFPFVEVEGPGVYEIAVGPIHAGVIEPGHFRFSVVGETIVRMEARQYYLHRGMEKLFQGRLPAAGIELAEQISGDTAIGHSLAYLMAVEAAAGIEVSEPDRLVRALLLELERLYNHATDLGSLANDTGFAIVDAHAQQLRETLLRINKAVTGHRLLRGALSLGGVSVHTLPDPIELRRIAAALAEIVAITLSHAIVRDRFTGTAALPTTQARTIGTLGYVARASGLGVDARQDHPFVELGDAFAVVTETGGDVLSRYQVRAREFQVSTAVIIGLISRLDVAFPESRLGSGRTAEAGADTSGAGIRSGLGLVEGWRGTIAHRVELATDGTIAREKVVDPSFLNWPSLPIALAVTIVPDFPLANKSFNQSYAGNDL